MLSDSEKQQVITTLRGYLTKWLHNDCFKLLESTDKSALQLTLDFNGGEYKMVAPFPQDLFSLQEWFTFIADQLGMVVNHTWGGFIVLTASTKDFLSFNVHALELELKDTNYVFPFNTVAVWQIMELRNLPAAHYHATRAAYELPVKHHMSGEKYKLLFNVENKAVDLPAMIKRITRSLYKITGEPYVNPQGVGSSLVTLGDVLEWVEAR